MLSAALTSTLAPALPAAEGWKQVGELGLALLLSGLVGLEREIHQKSAGLRTYILVGVGSALFMLVSKYAFMDIVTAGRIVLDPSRVAAQIVSGVGFLGGGLIFVRRESVRGLNTAAGVWVTAAIGAAAGGGLLILSSVTTGIYLVVATALPAVARRLPHSSTAVSIVRVRYPDGHGLLRNLLQLATSRGFSIAEVSTQTVGIAQQAGVDGDGAQPMVEVVLQVYGHGPIHELATALSEVPDVQAIVADDVNVTSG